MIRVYKFVSAGIEIFGNGSRRFGKEAICRFVVEVFESLRFGHSAFEVAVSFLRWDACAGPPNSAHDSSPRLVVILFVSLHSAGRPLFKWSTPFGCGPRRSNHERAFEQGVQHRELFSNGPGGEALPELVLALQNSGKIEGHGVLPKNRFSKRATPMVSLKRVVQWLRASTAKAVAASDMNLPE